MISHSSPSPPGLYGPLGSFSHSPHDWRHLDTQFGKASSMAFILTERFCQFASRYCSFTNSFVKLATHTLWHLVTEHCFANVRFISPFPWLMSRFFNHSCFLMVIFHSICSISRVLMFSTCLCLKSLERLSHKAK